MTSKDSKKLKVGDSVQFLYDMNGEVVEVGDKVVKISWTDGQISIIHHDDMQDVSRLNVTK